MAVVDVLRMALLVVFSFTAAVIVAVFDVAVVVIALVVFVYHLLGFLAFRRGNFGRFGEEVEKRHLLLFLHRGLIFH